MRVPPDRRIRPSPFAGGGTRDDIARFAAAVPALLPGHHPAAERCAALTTRHDRSVSRSKHGFVCSVRRVVSAEERDTGAEYRCDRALDGSRKRHIGGKPIAVYEPNYDCGYRTANPRSDGGSNRLVSYPTRSRCSGIGDFNHDPLPKNSKNARHWFQKRYSPITLVFNIIQPNERLVVSIRAYACTNNCCGPAPLALTAHFLDMMRTAPALLRRHRCAALGSPHVQCRRSGYAFSFGIAPHG
jgi:hypothetical protein